MKIQNNLTVGNPLKIILLFALPIICGNIFQQFYNVIDTVIVGHILGESAIAAVGGTAAVNSFFISIAIGMTNGFSIVIARIFGEQNEEKLKHAVAHTIALTVLTGVVMTGIAVVGIRPLLQILNTPQELMEQSLSYIEIVLMFFMITILYNMIAAILRGIGNSLMPLIFLIISALCNVVLDLLFIGAWKMGIQGAAIATMISQLLSVVLSAFYIYIKCPILHVHKKDFKWNGALCMDLFVTGLSMAMMFSIVAVGSITLQGAINSLGTVTIAAHSAARKIDELLAIVVSPLSVSASTYASQNYGARKWDRIGQGIRTVLGVGVFVSLAVNLFVFVAARPAVSMITGSSNEELLNTAVSYMKINMPFYICLVTFCVLRSTLQGLGRKALPLCTSVIEMVGKVLIASFLVPRIGYMGVCIAEPIVWTIGALVVGIDYLRFEKQIYPERKDKKYHEISDQ